MYQDPTVMSFGAWQTSNPIQAVTRDVTDWGNIDLSIGNEPRLRARLMALDEYLASLDPNDIVGRNLIMSEKAQVSRRLSMMNTPSSVTNSNRDILHAQAQEAERLDRAEQNPAQWTTPPPGQMTPEQASLWEGYQPPPTMYGAYNARGYVNPGESPEARTSSFQPQSAGSWLSQLMTPQGLRPLSGNFALDPIQQQQASQAWASSQGNYQTIEDWLQYGRPQAELAAEQWRLQSEKSAPRRSGSVNWLAAAAR